MDAAFHPRGSSTQYGNPRLLITFAEPTIISQVFPGDGSSLDRCLHRVGGLPSVPSAPCVTLIPAPSVVLLLRKERHGDVHRNGLPWSVGVIGIGFGLSPVDHSDGVEASLIVARLSAAASALSFAASIAAVRAQIRACPVRGVRVQSHLPRPTRSGALQCCIGPSTASSASVSASSTVLGVRVRHRRVTRNGKRGELARFASVAFRHRAVAASPAASPRRLAFCAVAKPVTSRPNTSRCQWHVQLRPQIWRSVLHVVGRVNMRLNSVTRSSHWPSTCPASPCWCCPHQHRSQLRQLRVQPIRTIGLSRPTCVSSPSHASSQPSTACLAVHPHARSQRWRQLHLQIRVVGR